MTETIGTAKMRQVTLEVLQARIDTLRKLNKVSIHLRDWKRVIEIEATIVELENLPTRLGNAYKSYGL